MICFRACCWLLVSLFAMESAWGYSLSEVSMQNLIALVRPELRVLGPGIVMNGTYYFTTDTPGYGWELWRSDGTAEETHPILDIEPGPDGSLPTELTELSGHLYFRAGEELHGRELWTSDGTPQGTHLVKDIVQGPASSVPAEFVAYNGKLLFRAYRPESGWELWSSDGSASGTSLVADIAPGPASSTPSGFTLYGNLVYFRADNGVVGSELWATNGTAAGTFLVKDIRVGPDRSAPSALNVVDGWLYFRALSAEGVFQLWRSNGTGAGTSLVNNAAAGGVKLTWVAPAFNADGSVLQDLAGYRIYFGNGTTRFGFPVDLRDARANSHIFSSLQPGTYYFAVTAVSSKGAESVLTPVVSARIY